MTESLGDALHTGKVLLRRSTGVLRLAILSEAPRQLQLLLRFEGVVEPELLLERLRKGLRHWAAEGQVTVVSYQCSGSLLLAQLRWEVTQPPDQQRLERLEQQLRRLAVPWGEHVQRALRRTRSSDAATELWARFGPTTPADYRHHTPARLAARDLLLLDRIACEGGERFALWGPFPSPGGGTTYRLQHYAAAPVSLNTLLPLLDNLGLLVEEEHDFDFVRATRTLYLKSFVVRGPKDGLPLAQVREELLQLLHGLRSGEVENDDLNRLLVATGLDRYQIDIFRGYRNYLFQLGVPFSRHRIALALIAHPAVTRLLYRYFAARFEPHSGSREEREDRDLMPLRLELAAALEAVDDASFDRNLRTLFNLIDATVRTSFFKRRESEEYFFAFKISDLGLLDLPSSRALYEIYVHAATMEGIHLRGGLVARGGIRWSDRPDDFRSEILGLLKTQMTKNVVIVPVGSKGGFVVKESGRTGEAGKAAYRTLIRGLLDLTDNRRSGAIERPPGVVAYDGDDPYLVVAADKGTAHFSDLANGISAEYDFWLGDAFASGGSHGYDHKELAITARGAWECVKVHFAELGRDIEREALTVVGIGDMSGDVFGNGMLRSRTIRLRGAFDHRHIFLDPDPDPEAAYAERARLFALPASSWDDYDRNRISPGGGVYSRDAKEIPLSPQLRDWLHLRQETIDPPGLIRLLLTAEVDLLWNGGIGTYVKATDEKHEEVGDRFNDAVRIDGRELRARVVGEGGNLGLTQRGRIEYALRGGRLNTDAVDNSGGVDCSDHEVNLKIFFGQLLADGVLGSVTERDRLLDEIEEEVCAAVLEDNRLQSLCLSQDERRCAHGTEPYLALIERLADSGLLDRKGEYLPDAAGVANRTPPVLTRPELAVVMAYAKMQLFQALLESPLPDNERSRELLADYFPRQLQKRFGAHFASHPLARELAATVLANRLVNHGGSTLCLTLQRQTGADPAQVAAGWLFCDDLLGAEKLRRALRQIAAGAALEPAYRRLLRLEELLATLCRDLLAGGPVSPGVERVTPLWRERLSAFLALASRADAARAPAPLADDLALLQSAGLSSEIAGELLGLEGLPDWWPSLVLAEAADCGVELAWRSLAAVRQRFGLDYLLREVQRQTATTPWEEQARTNLEAGFVRITHALTLQTLAQGASPPQDDVAIVAATITELAVAGAPLSLAALLDLLQRLQGLTPEFAMGSAKLPSQEPLQ